MRAAIVGAGLMGRWHAHAARRLGIPVVAVVDTHLRAAAEVLAGRIGVSARAFNDLAGCLDRCDVDVVHVCTPPNGHTSLVQLAAERGCHVLVEKPLAPTLGETEAILETARRHGVRVNPVHQFPFQNGVRRLLARSSELGDLVRIVYRTSSAGGIRRSPAERHALLAEILPHPVSLFHRFVPGFDPLQLEILGQAEDLRVAGRHGTTYLEAFITLRGRPAVQRAPDHRHARVGARGPLPRLLYHRPRSRLWRREARAAVCIQRSAAGRCVSKRPATGGPARAGLSGPT